MDNLREVFLKAFANVPLNLRDEIILVLKERGPISWNVAYVEVKTDSPLSVVILEELKLLNLI